MAGWRAGWLASAAGTLILAVALPVATARSADLPGPDEPFPRVSRARFLMGARLAIEARGPAGNAAFDAAFAEVARLESLLSNWRADSELSLANASAARAPVALSPDLFSSIEAALRWADATAGAFDPTVEPLVRSLGLRSAEGRLPVPEGAAPDGPETGGPVGWRGVRIDPVGHTLAFEAAGMGIDLGGIGKGVALDAAARVLRAAGVGAAMLDFGGQVLAYGEGPDDGGWRIGVADPGDRDRPALDVLLRSGSLATSANGERSVNTPAGITGHLLDPANGRPVVRDGSTTVWAASATDADALSTALYVMGPGRGLAWARRHEVPVLYLRSGGSGVVVEGAAGEIFERFTRGVPHAAGGEPAAAGALPSQEVTR